MMKERRRINLFGDHKHVINQEAPCQSKAVWYRGPEYDNSVKKSETSPLGPEIVPEKA